MDKEETEYMLRWSEHNSQVMGTFLQVRKHHHLDIPLDIPTLICISSVEFVSSFYAYYSNKGLHLNLKDDWDKVSMLCKLLSPQSYTIL